MIGGGICAATGETAVLDSGRSFCPLLSFADAELAEDGIENLFDADRAEHFAKGMQRVLKIDSDIFRRQTIAHCGNGAIARFQRAPQTIAMTSIDRDGAFRSEILLGDVVKNFLFELRQTLSGRAGNAKGIYIF